MPFSDIFPEFWTIFPSLRRKFPFCAQFVDVPFSFFSTALDRPFKKGIRFFPVDPVP